MVTLHETGLVDEVELVPTSAAPVGASTAPTALNPARQSANAWSARTARHSTTAG